MPFCGIISGKAYHSCELCCVKAGFSAVKSGKSFRKVCLSARIILRKVSVYSAKSKSHFLKLFNTSKANFRQKWVISSAQDLEEKFKNMG
jgi:hypothetical protein